MECGIKEKLSKAFLPEDIPRKEEIPLREMGKTDAISSGLITANSTKKKEGD